MEFSFHIQYDSDVERNFPFTFETTHSVLTETKGVCERTLARTWNHIIFI